MAHLIILHYSTPSGHEEFKQLVNQKLEYAHEGEVFTGKTRPLLSEIRMYDIRLKKEHIPTILAELGIQDKHPKAKGPWYSWHFKHTVQRFLGIARRLTGLKPMPEHNPEAERIKTQRWGLSQFVGIIDDLEQDGEEIL